MTVVVADCGVVLVPGACSGEVVGGGRFGPVPQRCELKGMACGCRMAISREHLLFRLVTGVCLLKCAGSQADWQISAAFFLSSVFW